MDAMALLCMLHADGPATLRNLRQAGCSSLEAVEAMEEERLSKLLGSPTASARRFAREARHLRERLGQGILDREESQGGALAPMPDPSPRADAVPADEMTEESEGEAAGEDGEDLPPRPVRERPEFEFGTDLAAAVREMRSSVSSADPDPVEVEDEVLASAVPALGVDAVDGLDEAMCGVLAEVGVHTLDELACIDPLALSTELGVGYTGLWRLAALARRASAVAETQPSRMSVAEFPPRAEPSILELEWNREIRPMPPPGRAAPDAAARETERENAGGPFA